MGKVKDFFKKHKWEIAGLATGIAAGTAAYFIGKDTGIKIGLDKGAEQMAEHLFSSGDYVTMKKDAFDNAIKEAQWYGADCLTEWMKKHVPEADKLCQTFADAHPDLDEFGIVFPQVVIDRKTGIIKSV